MIVLAGVEMAAKCRGRETGVEEGQEEMGNMNGKRAGKQLQVIM